CSIQKKKLFIRGKFRFSYLYYIHYLNKLHSMRKLLFFFMVSWGISTSLFSQETFTPNGVQDPREHAYAFKDATIFVDFETRDGGGADAHYCRATADIANGYFSLGAQRLEEIAERKDAGDDLDRAELYAQAARTWLKDKNLEFADHALARAIDLAPDAIALNLVAAEIASAEEEWLDVVEHVSRAEDNGIVSSDAYVLRGRALMALGDTESAADDVVRALSLDERNIDALILRGELQQAGVIIEVFVENASAAHD
ncbi:MAG: hypothetical protein AAGC77_14385, partial [Pseudomonadota bacterium]